MTHAARRNEGPWAAMVIDRVAHGERTALVWNAEFQVTTPYQVFVAARDKNVLPDGPDRFVDRSGRFT